MANMNNIHFDLWVKLCQLSHLQAAGTITEKQTKQLQTGLANYNNLPEPLREAIESRAERRGVVFING